MKFLRLGSSSTFTKCTTTTIGKKRCYFDSALDQRHEKQSSFSACPFYLYVTAKTDADQRKKNGGLKRPTNKPVEISKCLGLDSANALCAGSINGSRRLIFIHGLSKKKSLFREWSTVILRFSGHFETLQFICQHVSNWANHRDRHRPPIGSHHALSNEFFVWCWNRH